MKKLIIILALAYGTFTIVNSMAQNVVSKAVNNQAAILANV